MLVIRLTVRYISVGNYSNQYMTSRKCPPSGALAQQLCNIAAMLHARGSCITVVGEGILSDLSVIFLKHLSLPRGWINA